MSSVIASTYRGHIIEPLVYPHVTPRSKGSPPQRRYLAAVTVTHLETQATQLTKLARDYDNFGDARRAAEERGRHLIDAPEQQSANPFSSPDISALPPAGDPFSSLDAPKPPQAGNPFSSGAGRAPAPALDSEDTAPMKRAAAESLAERADTQAPAGRAAAEPPAK